jgi:hypothetical protein
VNLISEYLNTATIIEKIATITEGIKAISVQKSSINQLKIT